MRLSTNKYPTTDKGRTLLFVAQLLREQLTLDTFESFRVRTMDTGARVRETIAVIEDVRLARLPRAALKPVTQELQWSLQEDKAAQIIAGPAAIELDNQIKNVDKIDLRQLLATLRLVERDLAKKYRPLLESIAVQSFDDPKKRHVLRSNVRFWLSNVINSGYSAEFILRKVDETFFKLNIERAGSSTLSKFFSTFPHEEKTYMVYTSVNKDFGKYLKDVAQTVVDMTALPVAVGNQATADPSFAANPAVLVTKANAYDEVSAAHKVRQQIGSLEALTHLSPKGVDCGWHTALFVKLPKAERGRHINSPVGSLQAVTASVSSSGRNRRAARKYSSRILTSFDPHSTERLLSSINTVSIAQNNSSIESQLISLWSSVEVLLSEPPQGTPRIEHYANLIVPCICLRHVRRKIAALHEVLLSIYRFKFNRILNSIQTVEGIDVHLKFLAILIDPINKGAADQLHDLCKNNPLALHRMHTLQREYGTADAAVLTIGQNSDRVFWQIHRIYRARNNLVHAGKIPPYADAIVLNMYEYYRTTVATIVKLGYLHSAPAEIDQMVYEAGLQFRGYIRVMENAKKNPISAGVLARVLMGDVSAA